MMHQQQAHHQPLPEKLVHPRRRDIFFHFPKTVKLIVALIRDRRIPLYRKLAFGAAVLAFLVVAIFPDITLGLSFLMPVVGTILGIPLEAGVSWTVFALLVVSLLRVFPASVVSEHYERLFHHRYIPASAADINNAYKQVYKPKQ